MATYNNLYNNEYIDLLEVEGYNIKASVKLKERYSSVDNSKTTIASNLLIVNTKTKETLYNINNIEICYNEPTKISIDEYLEDILFLIIFRKEIDNNFGYDINELIRGLLVGYKTSIFNFAIKSINKQYGNNKAFKIFNKREEAEKERIKMNNLNNTLVSRMKLNSSNHSDQNFNTCIKFAVEKYIENDMPLQINCTSLHDAIIKAYKLFLANELHSIGIYDSEGNYNGSDALNCFTDNINKFDNNKRIAELEAENKMLLDFIKLHKAENSYIEYKKNIIK